MIRMNDFKREPSALIADMQAAANEVIESGWYVMGEALQTFEDEFASACGMPHGVGVGNGLDGLEIILRALEIGPGDEVITTPMTAFATSLAVQRSGATPVMADIDPDTAVLSLADVTTRITPHTRAVMPVHLYGQLTDMKPWQSFCNEHGLKLIEDCAQSHLAQLDGQFAGSFGIAGAYSFYPTKNLGAIGDAGMIVSHDDQLATTAKQLRNYGQSERYHHPLAGMNSRLDELQAALLSVRLRWLQEFTERRQAIAHYYHANIRSDQVQPLAPPVNRNQHVYHLFVVTSDHRDALQQHLKAQHIETLIHYPIAAYRQAGFKGRGEPLAHTERHAETALSLPCHPQLSDDEVQQVVDAVNGFEPD